MPHELGHALAARLLGYRHIRILIGSGRPLATFDLLGIHWLWNRIPLGGLTLATAPPEGRVRWKEMIFIVAGVAVSFAAALATWLTIERGEWSDGLWTGREVFFWANVLVLAENLLPYTFPTAFGSLQSDGLLLWNTMFRWGEVPQYGPRTIPRWEQVASRCLKWLVVLITGGTTLLLGLGGLWALTGGSAAVNLGGRLLAAAFCFALMWLTAWFTVHLAKQPVARVRGGVPSPFSIRAIEELRAQSWWTMDSVEAHRFAEDVQAGRFREATLAVETALKRSPRDVFLLMQKGDCQKLQGDFAGAESTYDEALSLVSDAHSTGYLWLLAAKLQCMLEREEVDRAEELCVAYLDGPAQIAEKTQWVDHVVCWALFHEPPRHLRQMERWTRKALGLAPTSLTLKGTLGGILAERGDFVEAEPLLRECRDGSAALHDQGITSLYLGMAAKSRGDLREARECFQQAMILHPEPWLIEKAKRALRDNDG